LSVRADGNFHDMLPTVVYRIAYRGLYIVTFLASAAAARLAADFRTLGAAGTPAIVLQFPVLIAWLVVRPISCVGFAGCSALATRVS
jgi:hypothetical protein